MTRGANLLDVLRREGLATSVRNTDAGRERVAACTVLIDGNPHLGPVSHLQQSDGGQEMSETAGGAWQTVLNSTPLQQAFIDQVLPPSAGYCTTGMLMAARALLDHNPRSQPREDSHRCTGRQHLPLHRL